MKKTDLLDVMNDLDPQLIAEAEVNRSKPVLTPKRAGAVLTTVFCAVTVTAALLLLIRNRNPGFYGNAPLTETHRAEPLALNNIRAAAISYQSLFLAQPKDTSSIKETDIKEGMTLRSAGDLLGTPLPDEMSIDYPFVYSWPLSDGRILYIVFETEDWNEFREDLRNGKYRLPEETVQYDELGIPFATENEMIVLKNWVNNFKATAAYILEKQGSVQRHYLFGENTFRP